MSEKLEGRLKGRTTPPSHLSACARKLRVGVQSRPSSGDATPHKKSDADVVLGQLTSFYLKRRAHGDQLHSVRVRHPSWRVPLVDFNPQLLERPRRWIEGVGAKLTLHGAVRVAGAISAVPGKHGNGRDWVELRLDLIVALKAPANYRAWRLMPKVFAPNKAVRHPARTYVTSEQLKDEMGIRRCLQGLAKSAASLLAEPDDGGPAMRLWKRKKVREVWRAAGPRRRWVYFGLRRDGDRVRKTSQSKVRERDNYLFYAGLFGDPPGCEVE